MRSKKTGSIWIRFLRFGMVGGGVAAVNLSLLHLASGHFGPTTSFVIAYIPTVTAHFLLNKLWAFQCDRRDLGVQMMQYGGVLAINFLVNLTIYSAAFRYVLPNAVLANLIAIPPTVAIAFLFLHFRIFSTPPEPSGATPSDPRA